MRLYSNKAYEILEAGRKYCGFARFSLKRGINGEIVASPNLVKKVFMELWDLRWKEDSIRTIKTRAADTAMCTIFNGGITIEARTASLVAALLCDKYGIESIRKHWGDAAVDEIVGAPFNPLVTEQRRIVLAEIEKVNEDMKRKKNEAYQTYLSESSAAVAPFKDTIEQLKRQIADLNARLADVETRKKDELRKVSDRWLALSDSIVEDGKKKIDELSASIENGSDLSKCILFG